MKLIIAGSRSITDITTVEAAIKSSMIDISKITEVVSGTASGVDKLGEQWAKSKKLNIHQMPADWNKHGKKAGAIRNKQMGDYADMLVAVWDGKSKGTKQMIDYMHSLNKRTYVFLPAPIRHVDLEIYIT